MGWIHNFSLRPYVVLAFRFQGMLIVSAGWKMGDPLRLCPEDGGRQRNCTTRAYVGVHFRFGN